MKIPDNYPKYVISMDAITKPANYNGIVHMSLRTFLKTDNF